ncbi:hypothetical protein ACHQM5_017619 [Ranunculus cassubicifolius]
MSYHNSKMAGVFNLLFVFVLLTRVCAATEFKVGDANGWTVPTSPNAATYYNRWAETHRFKLGDTLVFVYNNDSLLQVTKEDYEKCNTGRPKRSFRDGHTTIRFYETGPHYFISGSRENCLKYEKMVVTVMAYRGGGSSDGNGASSQSAYGIGTLLSLALLVIA